MTSGKISKDQIQKIVLSGIGFIALVYVYFTFFLGPLNKGRATAETAIADLQTKLASSKTDMEKSRNLADRAAAATNRFAALKAMSPEGAPIAWFPPRIKILFANQKIDKASIRLESSEPFTASEMAEWSAYNWIIDLPQTDFATLGQAIAELENAEPLLAVNKINIKAVGDDPQFQQVTLTATSTLRK
ncbi:MAG: hypothetical protein ABIR71_00180 [Chthoniobacterales bacterium]